MGLRVAIYDARGRRQRDELLAWCLRAGMQVVAVVHDAHAAQAMLRDGAVDRVVVAHAEQVRELLPDVIVAGASPRTPRPRRMR